MHDLYPKLEEADVIVIATPVYWCSMTAQIKACIDRWYALQSDGEYALKGKELALLMVYGDDDLYASGGITIIHTLEGICRYVGLAFAGIVHGSAMDIADASNDPLLVKRSFKLGKQLAES
jgi:multimeric flavodoxin WrbA